MRVSRTCAPRFELSPVSLSKRPPTSIVSVASSRRASWIGSGMSIARRGLTRVVGGGGPFRLRANEFGALRRDLAGALAEAGRPAQAGSDHLRQGYGGPP